MSGSRGGGLRFPLSLKLGLVLAGGAALLVSLLFTSLGPRAEASFRSRSDAVLENGRHTMLDLAHGNTRSSSEVLRDLIRHTAERRQQTLADLPLSLYGGDEERIRQAISETDAERSAVLERNVDLLAAEMQRRSDAHIDQTLEAWQAEQRRDAQRFARDVRTQSLWVSGSLFGSLFLLLGVGLFHGVVRPLRRLRVMTQAVQRGELDEQVPVRSRDEVGALSRDFNRMVRDLRESRAEVRQKNAELEHWNEQLESEVTRKTEHLERALEDLRRTQRELVHAAKMASVGTLAGGVAHEFNNLIGGIRGCAAECLEDETDGERREGLEVILRAADRATEVTRQLLRFSRQPVGQKRAVDLCEVLGDVLQLSEVQARRRQVELRREIASPLPLVADPGALHQVFLNLVNNAIQAMPEGGLLQVRAQVEDDELQVEVEDEGVGIAAEHLDRIYEPFFTTKDSSEDAFSRGTGLGLSVSYSIVEGHGGRIEVRSEPGKGTCFRVRLPRRDSPEEGQ